MLLLALVVPEALVVQVLLRLPRLLMLQVLQVLQADLGVLEVSS